MIYFGLAIISNRQTCITYKGDARGSKHQRKVSKTDANRKNKEHKTPKIGELGQIPYSEIERRKQRSKEICL